MLTRIPVKTTIMYKSEQGMSAAPCVQSITRRTRQ
ncbi:hypothetical protein E2C01_094273 [Portunus trituberculatus]|uniref:Uncharacterized protein n=1 Tax=Portunus trituberculatus TaxID=210409 RepID=A0A5B7K0C9_PORTR|nr:hypothetical protein [Portunus trituberculatus]